MASITHVVGARPNFMKAAPVIHAIAALGFARQSLVHTGQHYDKAMSDDFFRQLAMPEPDVNLGVGSGSHAKQTADVMVPLEAHLLADRPDVLVVYGDVNSTVAAALVAAKIGIPLAHVEAGLRSFDRTMPEEVNRVVTDRLADLLFTPSADGDDNLLREGVPPSAIHRVGNVMIDSLVKCLPAADARSFLDGIGLRGDARFVLVTLHRPSSVDDPALLAALVRALATLAMDVPIVFPVHPRTRARIDAAAIPVASLGLTAPVSYLEFLDLQRRAALVITDSGGVQEETTYLGVPCLTVRDNTERPITISSGTNQLVGRDPAKLLEAARASLSGTTKPAEAVPLWDGQAGDRIAAILREFVARS
jgi:UDP-N-acetylglucosamine 2-epimerase (non-hydrolysing)